MSESSTSGRPRTISRDPRGQAVIVAEADFRRRHGVVLVDDGDAAQAEQGLQRRARVQVAAAVLGVVRRQQQLRGGQPVRRQRLAPGLRQPDLPDRRRRLLFLQPQPRLPSARGRDGRARWRRRDHDHLDAARPQGRDVGGDGGRAIPVAAPPPRDPTISALPILTTIRRASARLGVILKGFRR